MEQKLQWMVTPDERALVVAALQTVLVHQGQQKNLPIALEEKLGVRELVVKAVHMLGEIEPAAIIPPIQKEGELDLTKGKEETGAAGQSLLVCNDETLFDDVRRFLQDLETAKGEKDRGMKKELWEAAVVLIGRVDKGFAGASVKDVSPTDAPEFAAAYHEAEAEFETMPKGIKAKASAALAALAKAAEMLGIDLTEPTDPEPEAAKSLEDVEE